MLLDEIERLRLVSALSVVLCIFVAGTLALMDGDPLGQWLHLGGLVVCASVSAVVALTLRDTDRYRPWMSIAFTSAACIAITSAFYFWGVFSSGILVVPIVIYFVAGGHRIEPIIAVVVLCTIPHAILGGLITAGVLDDRGIIQPLDLGTLEAIAALGIAQFVFAIAYLLARGHRGATLRAMEQLEGAAKTVAQREALLYEAKQELDRALKVGGPGRFTDQVLGELRLGYLIGRGAMGEVYEATNERTGEQAAVKLLSTASASDPHLVQRFLREVKIASTIAVPNVVRVIDVPTSASALPYLAMERLHGETLAEVLRDEPRKEPAAALEMLAGVAVGVDAAHDAGVIHRDLKPRNVFRHNEAGRSIWKILDFGISKLTSDGGTLTHNQIIGTPAYMAPEQARGEDIDERADIYALGAVAYRALTGRPAFTGKDTPAILYLVTKGLPPRPSTIAPLNAAVDDVLAIAMAKKPDQRFDSAAALVSALGDAIDGHLAADITARAAKLTASQPWGTVR